MFAIYCEGGQWLVTENSQDDKERFVYAGCKHFALQVSTKAAAVALLRRVRAHGMGAWLVPVESLRLDVQADKMTRGEVVAVASLAHTLLMQRGDWAAQTEAFKVAARGCLYWLLAQETGILMPVFKPAQEVENKRGQSWAAQVFADLKTAQRDTLDRYAFRVGAAV